MDEARLLARALGNFDFENRLTARSQVYEGEVTEMVSSGNQSLVYLSCLHYLNDREECDLVMECFRAVSSIWPSFLALANDGVVRVIMETSVVLARDVRITEASTEGCALSVSRLNCETLRGGFRGAARVDAEWRRMALDSSLCLGLEMGEGGLIFFLRGYLDRWMDG